MQPAFVPTMTLVGQPDTAVKEAVERVGATPRPARATDGSETLTHAVRVPG